MGSRAAERDMKVRIGIGTGAAVMSAAQLGEAVDAVETIGFDSLWWSDVLTAAGDDPLAAMAYAAGHGRRLKIGTTMVLPGRNPVRLAKQLATLDRLSQGRLLVTFVLGLRLPGELDALGVAAGERGRQVDELLPLLRRLWSEDGVDHRGDRWALHQVTVRPKPQQQPLDVWLGGSAHAALRRVGRLADGWLPALCTPEEAVAGRRVIEQEAALAGRRIDPEHFGVSIGYTRGGAPPALLARVAARRAAATSPRDGSPAATALADPANSVDVAELVPDGIDELRRLILRFVESEFSKFVVRPTTDPDSLAEEIAWLADGLLDLQT
jgi:probable F420-dependent oxidoreductase